MCDVYACFYLLVGDHLQPYLVIIAILTVTVWPRFLTLPCIVDVTFIDFRGGEVIITVFYFGGLTILSARQNKNDLFC